MGGFKGKIFFSRFYLIIFFYIRPGIQVFAIGDSF